MWGLLGEPIDGIIVLVAKVNLKSGYNRLDGEMCVVTPDIIDSLL